MSDGPKIIWIPKCLKCGSKDIEIEKYYDPYDLEKCYVKYICKDCGREWGHNGLMEFWENDQ